MKITINGQNKEFTDSENLDRIIAQLCKNPNHVIAELNGKIVKSNRWNETSLNDGDTLELVAFVGGG